MNHIDTILDEIIRRRDFWTPTLSSPTWSSRVGVYKGTPTLFGLQKLNKGTPTFNKGTPT
jgi:hypothetical protein